MPSVGKLKTMNCDALLNVFLCGFDVRDHLKDVLFKFVSLFHPIRDAFIKTANAGLQVYETSG